MQTIIDRIQKTQNKIFDNWHANVLEDAIGISEEIVKFYDSWTSEKQIHATNVLGYISNCLENKDYLTLADILEYEVLPLFKDLN